MKLLIVVHHRFELWRVPAWFVERLAADFPDLEIVQRDRYEGIEEHLGNAEIIFTISLRPEQFLAARKVQWIHAPTAAVHQFMFPELQDSDVVLTNSSEVHGPVVAEHVMALIFALAKKLPQVSRFQSQRIWAKDAVWDEGSHPQEIVGATVGLIGVGSIGRRVARMSAALGMRVTAVRKHVEKGCPEGVEKVFAPSALNDLLHESEFVVMAAPLIESTQKLMNAERFAVMKPNAHLINVGRGAQVDEVALAETLRNRRIGGAALDVFEQEPLPAESPLWELDNLLITPHTAGLTEKLWPRHYEHFSANLKRFLAGESLKSVVDKREGY